MFSCSVNVIMAEFSSALKEPLKPGDSLWCFEERKKLSIDSSFLINNINNQPKL